MSRDKQDIHIDVLKREQRRREAFLTGLEIGLKRESSFDDYDEFRDWVNAQWDAYNEDHD